MGCICNLAEEKKHSRSLLCIDVVLNNWLLSVKVLKWKSCCLCGSHCTPVKEGRIGGVPIVLDSD